MGTQPPRVSVVIPVKDRRQLLRAALDALDTQTFDDFEVVVVDDGSSDGSGDEARARPVKGREVVVLNGGGHGAVHARTLGVDKARGTVLAFTDSDCRPSSRWLELGVAAIDAGADVVNGKTVPARPLLPLERSMGSGEEGLYPTCNMLFRRSALERVGGFDGHAGERLGFRHDRRTRGDGFGEDTIAAWSVIRSGGTVTYEPGALVEHAVFPPDDLAEMLSRTARVAAFPGLVREVPELRGTLLRWRWQLGQRTRLPVYAAVGALLLRRPRLAATAVAWWAALRLQELRRYPIPWRRRLAALPAEMAIDAVMAAALAVGSARSRSVTL